MLFLKRNLFLAVAATLTSLCSASAQSNTDAVRRAETAIQDALKDPKKVRMIECLGVTVYAIPPANWKPPSKAECNELEKAMPSLSPTQFKGISDALPQRELDFQLGSLRVTKVYADQPVSITNSSNLAVRSIEIECGFFRGDELLDAARNTAEQVLPGQTAYISVMSSVSSGVTGAKCRIVKWQ